ncbi:MAG: hypothetical protein ABH950_09115 [Candidatus Altiarchaeota archaeon]
MSRLGSSARSDSGGGSLKLPGGIVLVAVLILFLIFVAVIVLAAGYFWFFAEDIGDSPVENTSQSTSSTTTSSVSSTTSIKPTCVDGIKNQEEDDVDCGGPCPVCESCSDGLMNQDEDAIDCGGPCEPCPSCIDRIQNQMEEGVDCGGPCEPCSSCFDGVQNGGEEGVDCAGTCVKECTMSEDELGMCLAREGVVLYYRTSKTKDPWSPRILEELGGGIKYVLHVNCDDDQDQCDDEDIPGTPWWIVYGDGMRGSVATIQEKTGCYY